MYNQSTPAASRRRGAQIYGAAAGRSRQGRGVHSQEAVRIVQLAVCLALFLAIFLGKGAFPQKLEQVQEDLRALISTDFDFQGALSNLGGSLDGGGTLLSNFGAFCIEVFGPSEPEEAPADLTTFRPPSSSEALGLELEFLGQGAGAAACTTHYAQLSRLGLKLTLSTQEPVPLEEPVTQPEEPPAVPAAGTVTEAVDYSGPELPENYTMDRLSLGELKTMTPVLGRLNSGYGYRDHPVNGKNVLHSGVDIGGQMGDPIAAFAAGTVEYTGEDDSYGMYLQLDHGNGVKSFYAHCSQIEVVKGQTVEMGDTVARIGSTGVSTGPHLHLELKYENTRLNPAYYVEFLEQ